MERIEVSVIHEGICFSEPVFFDDGKNMFLPAGKQAKPFHVAALQQWKIPYLMTSGHEINPGEYVAPTFKENVSAIKNDMDLANIEEFDDIDNIEELEDL